MACRLVVGSMLAALVLVARVDQGVAQVRNAYFSNGEISGTQRYQNEGQLPGPTKKFVKGRDKAARLFVVFGDINNHTVSGRLKDGDGKVVREFEREIGSAPNLQWRVWTWAFATDRLEAGTYTLDLVVDGRSNGTYGFTLR
jgi:hypothetical protein